MVRPAAHHVRRRGRAVHQRGRPGAAGQAELPGSLVAAGRDPRARRAAARGLPPRGQGGTRPRHHARAAARRRLGRPHGARPRPVVHFVFDGGTLADDVPVQLQEDELDEFRFVAADRPWTTTCRRSSACGCAAASTAATPAPVGHPPSGLGIHRSVGRLGPELAASGSGTSAASSRIHHVNPPPGWTDHCVARITLTLGLAGRDAAGPDLTWSWSSSVAVAAATASTAWPNASALCPAGARKPLIFRTYCSAAAWMSSSVTRSAYGGRRVLMLRHMLPTVPGITRVRAVPPGRRSGRAGASRRRGRRAAPPA